MERWKTALMEAMRLLSGRPVTNLEQWILLVATALVGILTLNAILKAVSDHGQGMISTFFAGSMGILLCLLGLATCLIFLPSNTVRLMAGGWLVMVPVLVTSLLVVVPLLCLLWRYTYLEVLFAWLLTLVAATLVVIILSFFFDLINAGSRNADRIHQRNQATEHFINQR